MRHQLQASGQIVPNAGRLRKQPNKFFGQRAKPSASVLCLLSSVLPPLSSVAFCQTIKFLYPNSSISLHLNLHLKPSPTSLPPLHLNLNLSSPRPLTLPLPETQALCDNQTPRPLSVRRYFCNLLLGFSGIVNSMRPSSTSSASIRPKYPVRLDTPSAAAKSLRP